MGLVLGRIIRIFFLSFGMMIRYLILSKKKSWEEIEREKTENMLVTFGFFFIISICYYVYEILH